MLTFTNSLCLLSITNGNPQISWPPKLFLSICFVGLERYNETGGYCPICYDALAPSSLLRLGRSQLQQHRQRAALSTGDAGFLIFFSGITNVLVFDKPLVFKRLVSVLCFFVCFFHIIYLVVRHLISYCLWISSIWCAPHPPIIQSWTGFKSDMNRHYYWRVSLCSLLGRILPELLCLS